MLSAEGAKASSHTQGPGLAQEVRAERQVGRGWLWHAPCLFLSPQ